MEDDEVEAILASVVDEEEETDEDVLKLRGISIEDIINEHEEEGEDEEGGREEGERKSEQSFHEDEDETIGGVSIKELEEWERQSGRRDRREWEGNKAPLAYKRSREGREKTVVRVRKVTECKAICMAIRGQMVVTGSVNGKIILYDYKEKKRRLLGRAEGKPVPVTAIDIDEKGILVAAGHIDGRILLWDIQKLALRRLVNDAHSCFIQSIQFCNGYEDSLVSVDVNGLVNQVSFSKMLWTSYNIDCLLDGSAGPIYAMKVLGSRGTNVDIRFQKTRFTAICSSRSTFVIVVEPEVRVLHKWPKSFPGLECLPSISWSRVNGKKVLLARCWDYMLEVLKGEYINEKISFPQFQMMASKRMDSKCIAVEWIHGDTIVRLDEKGTCYFHGVPDFHIISSITIAMDDIVSTYVTEPPYSQVLKFLLR